jgi:CDGSH-type Zn-finger protein
VSEKYRIDIIPNGPYRVSGGVPLKEMAPVLTFNGEPIDWHVLREMETPPGPWYDLCRCGQSKTRPFCDSTHETIAFDGTETASRAPYRDRAKGWTRGGETLRDDLPLCIGAGFCGTRTRKIWGMFEGSDDPAERQLMREMVWRCPSGRIQLFGADGFPSEPPLPREIAVLPGGPLWVRGGIPIFGADGREWEERNRVTLCRCGQSENKPFCDQSHEDIHFDER